MSNKKCILIISGHLMMAELLTAFLEQQFEDFTVIRVSSICDARLMLHQTDLILILIDKLGQVGSLISTLNEIKEISHLTKCLVLSEVANAYLVAQALRAGACCFLSKMCSSGEIVKAVEAAIHGGQHLSPDAKQVLVQDFSHTQNEKLHDALSPREFDVFVMIAQGMSLKTISGNLSIASSTVAVHKHNIMKKIGFKSSALIARYCIEHRLLGDAG